MPYRDIQPPIAGEVQVLKTGGSDTLIDLPTYLGYMNDNMNLTHGDLSPIYINGVSGESMTIGLITTANSSFFNAVSVRWEPIIFPTAGTIRKSFTTSEKPGLITAILTATFLPVVIQTGVSPLLGINFEMQLSSGQWVPPPQTGVGDFPTVMLTAVPSLTTHAYSISIVRYFTDTLPNTNYRVTAMAGHYSSIGATTTGQYKVDATGTNTLEFNAWSN